MKGIINILSINYFLFLFISISQVTLVCRRGIWERHPSWLQFHVDRYVIKFYLNIKATSRSQAKFAQTPKEQIGTLSTLNKTIGFIFTSLRTHCNNLAACFKIWSLGKYCLISGPGLLNELKWQYHSDWEKNVICFSSEIYLLCWKGIHIFVKHFISIWEWKPVAGSSKWNFQFQPRYLFWECVVNKHLYVHLQSKVGWPWLLNLYPWMGICIPQNALR